MSAPEYIKAHNLMTEKQKDAMHDLYMTGINGDGHTWVTYTDVEKAVAKIIMTTFEEDNMEAILALIAGMVIGAFLVIIIAVLLEGRR